MNKFKQTIETIRTKPEQLIIGLYLAFLGFGLSLYLNDGYYGISFDKFIFWRNGSLIFLAALILTSLIMVFIRKQKITKETFKTAIKNMDLTDWGMAGYAFFMTISFICSIDHEEALWGTFGWNVGWLSQMIMIFWYFAVKKRYYWHTLSDWLMEGGALLVMMIGILQRIGLLTISEGAGLGFYLSTIGNINWYAGYLSAMVPLLLGMFLCAENKPHITGGYCILLVIAFLACITNGSNSLYLLLLAVLPVMGLLSLHSLSKFKKFTLSLSMYGIASELIYHYLSWSPAWSFFSGNHDNYGMILIEKHRGLILAAISLGIGLLAEKFARKKEPLIDQKTMKTVLKGMAGIAFLGLITILILQVSAKTGLKDSWGNNRAALWRLASHMYLKLPIGRKLIGVGPDCFLVYLINDEECLNLMMEIYAAEILTNAHSEPLTMLVNIGLFGTIPFLFSMASAVWKSIPKSFETERTSRTNTIRILVIAGVLAHLLVSFQHMLLMPYVFVLLGACSEDKELAKHAEGGSLPE